MCLVWTAAVVAPVLVFGFDDGTSALALAFSAVGMSGGAVLVAEGWRRTLDWDPAATWGLEPGATLGVPVWIGALAGALSLGVVGEALGTTWWTLASEAFGWTLPTDALAAIADALLTGPTASRVLFATVVVLIGPILEELVFRGFLWRLLGGNGRPAFAIVWTSLMFAVWHFDPIQSVGVLPLAAFLGLLRWRTGSLWAPVVVHVANNGLALGTILLGGDEPTSPAMLAGALALGAIAFAAVGRGSEIR